ncbi:hypothetical protein JYU34_021855, partial [Plutella xylostella]
MREDSRVNQVAQYMDKYGLDILGISEARKKEFGEDRVGDLTLLYSGNDHKHEAGVAFLLSKRAKQISWIGNLYPIASSPQ